MVELPLWKIWNGDISSVSPLSKWIDERLTHKTSVFQIFHSGNSTFMNSFDKTKFSRFILQP